MNVSNMAAKLCQYSPAVFVLVAKLYAAMTFISFAVHSISSLGTSPRLCSMILKAVLGRLVAVEKFFSALLALVYQVSDVSPALRTETLLTKSAPL
jgi:hypothetical protein